MADTLRQRKAAAAEGEPAAASAADDKLDKVRSSKAVEPDWLTRHERFVPFALFLVAAFTRFYRLDKPAGVVFDESHFGRFTMNYLKREYFFDIHPPLAKMVLWLVATLTGYDWTQCSYEHIGQDYGADCRFIVLRATTAAFSTATCVLMYYIVRAWGAGVWGGVLASFLLVTDFLNLTEGRLILLDAQLMFWIMVTLHSAQRWWARWNEHVDAEADAAAGRPVAPGVLLTGRERAAWAAWIGFTCSAGFGVKMTALATPAIVAVESFFGIWFLKRSIPLPDLLGVLVAAFATFAAWFACHLGLMINWHVQVEEFMTPAYQKTLLGSPSYDPAARHEGFFWTLFSHNKRMIVHNAAILAPHPWQSKWHEWILDQRGVSYYGKDVAHAHSVHVYLIGNPLLHWSILGAFGVFAVLVGLYLRYRTHPSLHLRRFNGLFAQLSFCFVVYWVNLLPYIGIARSTFIYHYMPALMYGQLLTARLLEGVVPRKWFPLVAVAYIAVLLGALVHWGPWIYALPLSPEGHERRRWLPRWN